MATKIKTFEAACKSLGLNPKSLPDVSKLPVKHRKALIAHYKLITITEAINEGWQPDWSNLNEWKYYAWFFIKADKKRPSGFGFSYTGYAYTYAGTHVGSRLCFKSSELAKYAAKTFAKLYQEYLLMS